MQHFSELATSEKELVSTPDDRLDKLRILNVLRGKAVFKGGESDFEVHFYLWLISLIKTQER